MDEPLNQKNNNNSKDNKKKAQISKNDQEVLQNETPPGVIRVEEMPE